ncbi:MAG: phosphoribosylaminoimidazolesuccinocarboxamide synthase [Candidatus Omnitrophota bacterium]|jgi:phosphoribosylaminoimidazole-succinocarboxamide synthase
MNTNAVILRADFKDLKLFKRGKVRDVYDFGDKLLIVSTDRISCFDVVLPSGIPRKGEVLTRISAFWFEFVKDLIPHHMISCDVADYPPEARKYDSILRGRSMLVLKTQPLAVECVVRGYIAGSAWKEYKMKQSICGVPLPKDLKGADKLAEPIFTPSTKEDAGHDINVDESYVIKRYGGRTANRLKESSLSVYKKAADYARLKGIIIADTKFEFGMYKDEIILIDEALTPDSSRFWPADAYQPGKGMPSFDKQFVRDYLETLDWDKTPPGPSLPDDIIEKTTQKYLEAYRRLTGKDL